jgi:hypothetical protein
LEPIHTQIKEDEDEQDKRTEDVRPHRFG